MQRQYLPGHLILTQTEDRSGRDSPSPLNFHMPLSEDLRHLYKIEKEAALKRMSYILRLLTTAVITVGALMLALVYANKISIRVTLTISTLPPCYHHDELNLTAAKQYLRSPMRAYVPFNVCADGDVDVLMVVQSSNANVQLRQVIRETWAARDFLKRVKYVNIEVLFVLEPLTGRLPKDVAAEMIAHSDVLIPVPSKFFPNTVGRNIALLQWVAHFCPHAKFVVNTLDVIDVNIALILNFTKRVEHTQRTMFGLIKNTLAGRRQLQLQILDGSEVDDKTIATLTKYNQYVLDDAYILTGDAVPPMCIEATKTAIAGVMKTDDENITVTGIWPMNAGVDLHDVKVLGNR